MPLAPQITNTPVDITVKDFAISAVSYTSSTATYTATGHTFAAGDTVIVSGLAPDGYNGTFTIASIATNTFTVANTTNLAVTTATGDAYSADNTDYDQSDVSRIFIPNSEDLSDPTINPALAQAQQAISDAATAIATANTANANATSAAYTAGVAQTTANGKNTAHYSTSGPSGSGTNGDIWFQVNGGGTVLYQYVYNSGSWVSAPISDTVIANLDAGKINAGTITGIAYNNGSGTFSVSPSGVLVASSATITGNITATSGTFTGTVYASAGTFTGTVTATSGSFTGSIYASSGTIGGFTIVGNDYLNYGSTYIYGNSSSSPYAILDISKIIGASRIEALGSASNALYSGGGLQVAGLAEIFGNLQVHAMSASAYTPVYWNSSNFRFYATTSSARYKENITDIPAADYLSAILKLEPVTFTYKSEYTDDTNRLNFGLIAESVAQIPELEILVNKNTEGQPDSVLFDRLAIFLVPAIKQLNDRLKKLEGK